MAVNAVQQIAFLANYPEAYPLWNLLIVALNIVVLYAGFWSARPEYELGKAADHLASVLLAVWRGFGLSHDAGPVLGLDRIAFGGELR